MNNPFPTYKTERFVLRSFNENDLDNVFLGLSNASVIRYYGVSFKSLEETKKQIQWFADVEKEGTGIWWAISSADHSIFFGAAGLYYLNKIHRKAEIGCWILPEFWGKGIMKEVIPVVVDHGFRIMNLHRIEGLVETENMSCKKAIAKVDFIHEGTMRDCEIKNGNWISLDIYARINREDIL